MSQSAATKKSAEFQEIGHCGGQVIITIATENGQRSYSLGIRHSSPRPAAWFAIYALSQGIPVETIQMGGIGDAWNPPPTGDCFTVFIASDSTGLFGHACPSCTGYWRSKSAPSRWMQACPYCGFKGKTHQFRTEGQIHFVEACCSLYKQALSQDKDGDYVIDMDKIADAVSEGTERPKFYYAEETQQNEYKCDACGDVQDILGHFGYCSCCGTRNDLQEFEKKIIPRVRERINTDKQYESCVRDAVSAFDSFACKYVEQLLTAVPLTPERRGRLANVRFHNLGRVGEDLDQVFGVNIFSGLSADEMSFAKLMFHRRHVYEHKGGEVDQKYIDDSGDDTVRLRQALRENQQSAHQILNHLVTMARNLHNGFHSIFPPEAKAVRSKA